MNADNPSPDSKTPAGTSHGEEPSGVPDPQSRGGSPQHTAAPPQRRKPSRTLIDTAGPDPDSPLAGVRLTIGVIAGTHGVDGELKLKVLTDHPEHIPTLERVYLGESETATRLLDARSHGDQMLIRLEGVGTPEAGKKLGGLKVRIAATDAVPLEPGEYFIYQLIGLTAQTESGDSLGTVTDLIETGAHDVLVISSPAAPDLLVPNHPAYVIEITPERGLIVIRPPVYDT